MGDQEALKEAIMKARQKAKEVAREVAAKHQSSVANVRPPRPTAASDHSTGTIKVTHAYEKPPPSENNNRTSASNQLQPSSGNSGSAGGGTTTTGGGGALSSSSSDRERSRDRSRDRDRDRGGDRGVKREYGMLGGHAANNNNNNSSNNNNNPYSSAVSSADERIEIIIPHAVIGLVIGKGGENIKRIQNETGATVRVDPNTVDEKGNKVCTITGTKRAVEDAHTQVSNVIENAATNKRPRVQVEGSEQYRMKIPASRTGAIIGKGGETIKSIKQQSGCDIELDKGAKECGPDESVFIIRGTQDKILKARAMIEARLASRGRDNNNDNTGRSNHQYTPKGVATGANAAPVAQFTDLPTSYPAVGHNSADASAATAWAAYYAQYYNHTGAQPSAANLPYAGQNLLGATSTQQPEEPQSQLQSQPQQQQPPPTQPQQQPQQVQQQTTQSGQPQQDFTSAWVEYYIMQGRPDYAEQLIAMTKKPQQ